MTQRSTGGSGPRRPEKAPAGLTPIMPADLKIASLSRRKAASPEADSKQLENVTAMVSVKLYRSNVDVDDDAMHFRLKMAIVHALRRRFKRAQLDVDDAATPADGPQAFIVRVDPANDATQDRARAVVTRVLRWRRWRTAPGASASA